MKITLSRDEVKEIVGKHFGLTDFILEINTERATKSTQYVPKSDKASTTVYTDENMLVVDKPDPESIALKEEDPDCGIRFDSSKFAFFYNDKVVEEHNKDASITEADKDEVKEIHKSKSTKNVVKKPTRKSKKKPDSIVNPNSKRLRVDYEGYKHILDGFIESGDEKMELPLDGVSVEGAYWRWWRTRKMYNIRKCKLHRTKDSIFVMKA